MKPRLADAEFTAFLDEFNARQFPLVAETGAAAVRAAAAQRAVARPRGPEMSAVRDLSVPPTGLRARLYRPTPGASALALYLHGGGWVIGDLETHDRACRRLAAQSGVSVLALDYRRAPEHPWPAAVDDAVAALRWVASRPPELDVAPTAVAIVGDSAGGTTAALACVRLRDEGPEALPRLQVLIYANTDLGNSGASMSDKGHGFGLDVADIEWFNSQWVPDPAMLTDPRVSPLFAPDLSGLPAAIVITCEHDPLRDQGEAYADRLREAGVPTIVRREEGMVHNFMLWDNISPACAAALDRVAADLAAALSSHDA
ncbi:MAG: alpha/beta hydrolase [Actinomycetota bacterium]|nr:alpha/beta hydrolase [Actinomycetota bacterium]